MNYIKNSRSALSRLLRYKPAVCPRPPLPPPQEPTSRYYCTSRRRPHSWREHFQSAQALLRRYYASCSATWSGLNENLRSRIRVAAYGFSGGAVITIYYGRFETVPYTNRSHLIIVTPSGERRLGQFVFDSMKKQRAADILPQSHPHSVRVNRITEGILRAARRGLAGSLRDDLRSDEAKRDDGRWVVERRQSRGKARPQTKHLDGLNWEVIVVKDNTINAMCLPGGKILVHTALLDNFRTDAEIATVIGHEIGHVIARHTAENLTKFVWIWVMQIVIVAILGEDVHRLIDKITTLLLELPNSRKMELEADHIGILVLAAAGFDPHIAPKVYAKMGKLAGDSPLQDFTSTHPSAKKRSQELSQAKVMDEAMVLYEEARAGHRQDTQGFLF